jgi:uncharacterized protein (TIGR02145 family)
MNKLSMLLILLFIATFAGFGQSIQIGNQVWTTKNLDVTKFRNGDPIPQAKTKEEMEAYSKAKEPAWCYYDFDASNGKKYGKMYNGYAMIDPRNIAPNGWHVPSEEEYSLLVDFLGGEETAQPRLKSKSGWYNNKNGTNSSGFSALPGGMTSGSKFINEELNTSFWSNTPFYDGSKVYYGIVSLSYNDGKRNITIEGKEVTIPMMGGMSPINYMYIRLVKD